MAYAAVVIALLAFAVWVPTIVRMVYLGTQAARLPHLMTNRHERFVPYVNGTSIAMVLTAALSHLVVRHQIGGASGMLFAIHLPFAIACVLCIWLMQRFTGAAHPRVHVPLARFVLVPSFLVTAITGPILLVRLLLA